MNDSPSTRDRLVAVLVAVAVGFLGLVLGVVFTAIVLLPLVFAGIIGPQDLSTFLVISLIMTQGVAFGSTAFGYLLLRGVGLDYLKVRVPSLRDLLWAGGGYVLALVAVAIGGTVVLGASQLAGGDVQPASNQAAEIGMQNPEILLLLIPASFLIIGPGEELLFRGVVQGRIRESFGPVAGVVIASAIFAAIHFTALSGGSVGRLATIAILFFPSLVFGTAYELSDNLVVPALIHGAYNATLFGGIYVSIRFLGESPVLI